MNLNSPLPEMYMMDQAGIDAATELYVAEAQKLDRAVFDQLLSAFLGFREMPPRQRLVWYLARDAAPPEQVDAWLNDLFMVQNKQFLSDLQAELAEVNPEALMAIGDVALLPEVEQMRAMFPLRLQYEAGMASGCEVFLSLLEAVDGPEAAWMAGDATRLIKQYGRIEALA